MIKPVTPETSVLPVQLARMLEEEILSGVLAPGTRITEDAVLERVNVSRSPVREAFRILEQDGLVVRGERRGVKVPPLSIADLDEVYGVRVVLEGLVAEAAARNATDQAIALLNERLAVLLKLNETTAPSVYFNANIAFSQALYAASQNATLKRIAYGLSKQALRYRFLAYSKVAGFQSESRSGARKLLEAITAGDAKRAAKTQSDLVRSSWRQVRKFMLQAEKESAATDRHR